MIARTLWPRVAEPRGDVGARALRDELLVGHLRAVRREVGVDVDHRLVERDRKAGFSVEPADVGNVGFDQHDVRGFQLLAEFAPARLLIVFRDTIHTPNPPYHGWAGTLTWN